MRVFDGRQGRQRFFAGTVISMLGVLFFAIPFYDIWEDVTRLDWRIAPTLIENSLPLVCTLALVIGGMWLAQQDWKPRHVATVAKWTVLGSVGAALAFGWVMVLQLWAMHSFKPVIIALDGLLISAVAAFGIGINRAQSNIRRARVEQERERFAGLFTNTTDAVAAVVMEATEMRPGIVNERFRETFDKETDQVLENAIENIDSGISHSELQSRLQDGETLRSHLTHTEGDTTHEFLVRFVPYEITDGKTYFYVVITDITEQRELAREQEANRRLEKLHEVESALQSADTYEKACDTVIDAATETLPDKSVRVVLDDEVVASSKADNRRDVDEGETYCISLDRAGAIEVCGAAINHRERTMVDLLGTHFDQALKRIDRKRQLEDEREQLEFINRTLRHNLLNDIQVIRSRIEVLDSDGDFFDDHYDVIIDHLDNMADFVQTMRTYMQTVISEDDHTFESRSLRAAVTDEIAKARRGFPEATIETGSIPDVPVLADDLLGPVFENLLTNAIEHNDSAEPRVTVDGVVRDGEVTICVADNGPGIPDDRTDAIFERGEYGAASSGSGFGLFLVTEVVESYGGEVEVEDNAPHGALFRVTLPIG